MKKRAEGKILKTERRVRHRQNPHFIVSKTGLIMNKLCMNIQM